MSLYYSQRAGRGPMGKPGIDELARLLTLTVEEMRSKEYLQEWFGKDCVDDPDDLGRAGVRIVDYLELETGRVEAWPISHPFVPDGVSKSGLEPYEDWLFDLIEFFFLHVSEGVDGRVHQYEGCGWHYEVFDSAPARAFFMARINRLLPFYGKGYRLSAQGEVELTADDGFDELLDTPVKTKDPEVAERVAGAIALFRNRARSPGDLRNAVRNTFDALERLRPAIKEHMMKGDEGGLFQIANGYTIRHLDAKQKNEYDSSIWHSWMFYVNLSTIHLMTRTVAREHQLTHTNPSAS